MKQSIYLFFTILLVTAPGLTQQKNDTLGVTGYPERPQNITISNSNLSPSPLYKKNLPKKIISNQHIDGFVMQSESMDNWIAPKEYLIYKYNSASRSLRLIEPIRDQSLINLSKLALKKSPTWLRNALRFTLSELDSSHQQRWANIIVDSEMPYIDEIAFCVAYSSPAYLRSPYSFPHFFVENAMTIYDNDQHLDYVKIVNHQSGSDNFYSTTAYRIIDQTVYQGSVSYDTTTVEIPRNIYYWYVVHPKISDEIPTYIDPTKLELNHRDNISKTGNFWRTFFFNQADPGYPIMKEMLASTQFAWDDETGSRNAMQLLNAWISSSMPEFTSNNERPHQPMRIYRKHYGRCGEFSDIRTAAARTALIPCTNVGSLSTDHVWNEFYIGRWFHWDNAIDSPMMYENNWGKVFGSVYERRSDGKITTITRRYSDICRLDLTVTDKLGTPIDGAVVRLYMYNDQYENYLYRSDNYGLTDSNGSISFEIGEDRRFFVKVISDYGNYPANSNMELLIDKTQKYSNYTYDLSIDNIKDTTTIISSQAAPGNDFYLSVTANVESDIKHGPVWYDDLDTHPNFLARTDTKSEIDIFTIKDLAELDDLSSINSENHVSGELIENHAISLPDDEDVYLVIANLENSQNLQEIIGTVALINRNTNNPKDITLKQNFPNPFNAQTTIPFSTNKIGMVTIDIYNLLGEKVKTLRTVSQPNQQNNVTWNGLSSNGSPMPTGIYFYKLRGLAGKYKQMSLVK